MRVHEIAKKLGMESRVVIPELVRLGIQVTSHSNAVEDDAARWAIDVLQGKAAVPKGASFSEGIAGKGGTKKSGGRLLKKDETASGKGGAQATISEPKKPEKKHILIKKKKTEEELAAEATAFPSTKEESMPPAGIGELATDSTIDTQKGGEPTAGDASHDALLEGSDSVATEAPMPGIPMDVQEHQQPVLPSDKPVEKGKESETKVNKKGSLPGRESQTEDKAKKPKKGPRLKNEELFAARFEDAAVWQDLRPLPTLRREERVRQVQITSVGETTKPRKKVIKVTAGISVKDFAEVLGQKPAEILRKLMDLNVLKALNQPMDIDAGVLIAEGYGIAVEAVAPKGGEALLEDILEPGGDEQWEPRYVDEHGIKSLAHLLVFAELPAAMPEPCHLDDVPHEVSVLESVAALLFSQYQPNNYAALARGSPHVLIHLLFWSTRVQGIPIPLLELFDK